MSADAIDQLRRAPLQARSRHQIGNHIQHEMRRYAPRDGTQPLGSGERCRNHERGKEEQAVAEEPRAVQRVQQQIESLGNAPVLQLRRRVEDRLVQHVRQHAPEREPPEGQAVAHPHRDEAHADTEMAKRVHRRLVPNARGTNGA